MFLAEITLLGFLWHNGVEQLLKKRNTLIDSMWCFYINGMNRTYILLIYVIFYCLMKIIYCICLHNREFWNSSIEVKFLLCRFITFWLLILSDFLLYLHFGWFFMWSTYHIHFCPQTFLGDFLGDSFRWFTYHIHFYAIMILLTMSLHFYNVTTECVLDL